MRVSIHSVDQKHFTHNGKSPIYPPVTNSQGHKAKDKRRNRHTQSYHGRPDAHVSTSFIAEKGFRHNCASDGGGWADEEGSEGAAESHCGIGMTEATSDVADGAAY